MTDKKVKYNRADLIKTIFCFVIILVFWFVKPLDPITPQGMKVIGVFIGTVLLLSMVDTVWPVFFSFAILPLTGVVSLNEVLAGSLGSWIITFVIASFIMTRALNESGFTSRLTTYYMTRKFASKSPWLFTFSFFSIAMIVGMFMDQVPATAFFLSFTKDMLKKIGYDKDDKYSNILIMGVVFSVNIGGAATPISHSLVMLGLGIFNQITGQTINLLTYMIYGIPTALVLLILLCVLVKYIMKPDVSKLVDFDTQMLKENMGEKMQSREKITILIFFTTVFMWILPGIASLFLPADNDLVVWLGNYTITFWGLLAVVLLSTIRINDQPILSLKSAIEKGFPWGVILFISIGVLLGGVVSNPKVGLSDFIIEKLNPVLESASPAALILLFAFITLFLTNFASNVTTITVMTGVAVTVAMVNLSLDPVGIALTTTMCGSLAFVLPSSFAPIAMLHSDEYSNRKYIIQWGAVMLLMATISTSIVGYNLITWLQ